MKIGRKIILANISPTHAIEGVENPKNEIPELGVCVFTL